jgi:hypothetical protein
MKYNRKDRTKVVALVVILVVFWAFIIFEFTTLSKRTKAKLDAHERTHAAQAAQTQTGQQPTGAAPTSPALRFAALVTPVAPPKNDPFRPIIQPRNQSQLTTTAQSQTRREEAPPASAQVLPPLPKLGGRDALQLTGIIAGSPSTAVLRLGKEHYVVREGDLLDGQLRVQQITRNTVVLRDGRSTYTLRLGR